jgi:sialidase-1
LGGIVQPNCNECQAAELSDGCVLLNIRTYRPNRHYRLVARSRDGGRSFTAPEEDRQLVDPVCQASLLSIATRRGELLFSNPASTRREHLTVRLSTDDGRTWSQARRLHNGPAAYSCLAVLPDGSYACLYEGGKQHPYEALFFVRFSHAWLWQRPATTDR